MPREESTLPESISATEIAAPAQIRNNERLENPLAGESFDIQFSPSLQESTVESTEMVKQGSMETPQPCVHACQLSGNTHAKKGCNGSGEIVVRY
jgi:hypothetical protein